MCTPILRRLRLALAVAWVIFSAAQALAQSPTESVVKNRLAVEPHRLEEAAARCEDPGAHNGSQLCAQWAAANAARESAAISLQSLRWSIGGFIALLLTLVASGWAAWAATKAARAAERSIELADASAKRQLRSYLVAKNFQLKNVEAGQAPVLTYEVKNVGQTPAYNVRVLAERFETAEGECVSKVKRRFSPVKGPISETVLGSGDASRCGFVFDAPLNSDQVAGIRAGTRCVGVFGVISYRDIFKRRHLVTFKLFLHQDHLEDDGTATLSACADGNRAN